jgi:hypothetical protein
MVAGTAAASPRTRGGSELGPALDPEGRHLLFHLAALAAGAFDLGFAVENDLLEIVLAARTMVFKNGHFQNSFFSHCKQKFLGKARR